MAAAAAIFFASALLLGWRYSLANAGPSAAQGDPPARKVSTPVHSNRVHRTTDEAHRKPRNPQATAETEATHVKTPQPEKLAVVAELTAWPVDKGGIKGAMTEMSPEFHRCYQENLDDVPGLQGRMEVSFVVEEMDGIGQVVEVDIDHSAVDDGPLEDCVMDAMEQLQFDAPAEALTVRWPFMFRAERQSQD